MTTLLAFIVGVAVVFGGAMLVQFIQGAAAGKSRNRNLPDERPTEHNTPVVPLDDLTDEIHSLLAQDQKIPAIKLVRTHTGWELKEAKAYVENLHGEVADPVNAAIATPPHPTDLAPKDWQPQMIELLEQGRKIPAIQLTREKTGLDLKGAKAYVEDQQRRLQAQKKAEALRPSPPLELSKDWQTAILELLEQDQTIPAIQLTREKTGLGLKEAKEYVDEQQRLLEQRDGDGQPVAQPSLLNPQITSQLELMDYMRDCFRQGQQSLAIQEMIKLNGFSRDSATQQVAAWWEKWTEEGLPQNHQPRLYRRPAYASEAELRTVLRELLLKGQKIEAIKRTRRHFNIPLKAAKEYVEAIMSD